MSPSQNHLGQGTSRLSCYPHSIFQAIDGAIDGAYLGSSLVSYAAAAHDTHSDAHAERIAQESYHGSLNLSLIAIETGLLLCVGAYIHYRRQAKGDSDCYVQRWLLARDILSGLKNGRHAVMNWVMVTQLLSHVHVYSVVNPYAVAVGVVLAPVLCAYRRMQTARAQYREALLACHKEQCLISEELRAEGERWMSWKRRSLGFSLSFIDGVTDGPYQAGCLCVFVLSVASISVCPPVLIAGVALLAAFTACSVIAKVSDEVDEQNKVSCLIDNGGADDASCEEKASSHVPSTFFWRAMRTTISSAKNVNAAVNGMSLLCGTVLRGAVKTVCALVPAFFYAMYSLCMLRRDTHQKQSSLSIEGAVAAPSL